MTKTCEQSLEQLAALREQIFKNESQESAVIHEAVQAERDSRELLIEQTMLANKNLQKALA